MTTQQEQIPTFGLIDRLKVWTGGRPAVARNLAPGRLVIYPSNLKYRELLASNQDGKAAVYYLAYPAGAFPGIFRMDFFGFITRLAQTLGICSRTDIFLMTAGTDSWPVLAAATICRLKGVPVHLHDFSFADGETALRRRLAASIPPSPDEPELFPTAGTLDAYRTIRKSRAVPSVIAVGDFRNSRVCGLARRAWDLVKQKYPRTEFILTGLTDTELPTDPPGNPGDRLRLVRDEKDFLTLFAEGDMVLLLSPGRAIHLFTARAEAAGFPVILNGFGDESTGSPIRRPISVPRDSYTALAEAIIRLVDNDEYYRSFSA